MKEGFIHLYRSLLDSQIFASEKGLKIWVWLLLKASWKKRFVAIKIGKGETIISLERGELLFGRFAAEESIGIDGSTIYKWIKKMEVMEMITVKSSSHYTIITICNYDEYNDYKEADVAATEQPWNTYNKENKVKEEKEEKDIFSKSSSESLPEDERVITPKQPSSTNGSHPPQPAAESKDDIRFEKFRVAMKKYPGSKDGYMAMYKNFKKKVTEFKDNLDESIDIIPEAIDKYTKYLKKTYKSMEDAYIKNASTWINKQGWRSDYSIPEATKTYAERFKPREDI